MDSTAPDGMMVNVDGYYVPVGKIRPDVLLEDQLVRNLCDRAEGQQAQLLAFREAAFSDADHFMQLIAEKYGAKARSAGNTQFMSFDGLSKVEISTGHFLTLGPELQAAKSLIDECLARWSKGADANLQAIVADAFAVGADGKLRTDRVLELRRVAIDDATWKRAMEAISDAVRVTRSKRYVRFHRRDTVDAPWKQIALDAARL